MFSRAVGKRISSIRLNEQVVLPTPSFPVSREKVQSLGSGRLVSTGEWWGSWDRLWPLIKSWYILSATYLFVLVRSWAKVVAFMSPMMRGVQFSFSLIMACISKREACASGELPKREACASEQCICLHRQLYHRFCLWKSTICSL